MVCISVTLIVKVGINRCVCVYVSVTVVCFWARMEQVLTREGNGKGVSVVKENLLVLFFTTVQAIVVSGCS